MFRHEYTCAYCVGDGLNRPTFVDREDFEAHMAYLHYNLPFGYRPMVYEGKECPMCNEVHNWEH